MNPNFLNQMYTLLWTFILPFALNYLIIWSMWLPRRAIPHGNIFAMSVFTTCVCMIYAGWGSEVFDWIQRL